MARIRNVKPEFFRHELLQELEVKHPELRPMLVYQGLWCAADKNGVFPWRPRQLKLDILPFVPFEIEQSLGILAEAGLIRRFEAGEGDLFGYIPTFVKHQRLSGKEVSSQSRYPLPGQDSPVAVGGNGQDHTRSTREAPEKHPGSTREAPGSVENGEWRMENGEVERVGEQGDVATGKINPKNLELAAGNPDPGSHQDPPRLSSLAMLDQFLLVYWGTKGRLGWGAINELRVLAKKHGLERMDYAIREAAKHGACTVAYVQGILEPKPKADGADRIAWLNSTQEGVA